jgi:cellulose synthase (UDP-forming)
VWVGIRLNDTFVTKRRLSIDDCGDAKAQSFAIPVSLLYSSNTLNVELLTNRSDTNVSDPASVVLQVLPASTLKLGNPGHFVRMPRLSLFAAAGYPFTSKADGSETTVLIPAFPTVAQVGLYLDAMSFLGAQVGVTAVNFEVSNSKSVSATRDRNFLVIASSNDEGTFRQFEPSMFLIPANGKFEFGDSKLPWGEWLSRAWFGRREATEKLMSLLEGENGAKFLMEQFRSPYRADRSVVLLATRSETDDQPYFDRLAESSREGLISGGLAIAGDGHFQSFNLNSRSYTVGANISLAAVYGWLRFHLWMLPLMLVGAFLLLAFWWEQVLSQQAKRRLEVSA